MIDAEKILATGKQVIDIEMQALASLGQKLENSFVQACQYLLNCEGHIVVLGMGKSGHIANKIAATLASTGSPAFYVHPGEASHGDLGMITKKDVVLAISNSGNTAEIVAILPVIKQLKVPLITLTGHRNSVLAQEANINIDISVAREACPLGLAPTSSTTAALVMGDALAITLIEARGFTADDFALSHPGGILGKRLLLRIDELMRSGNSIPKVAPTAPLQTALVEMTAKMLGMTTVVDNDNRLLGIYTDGDLRRTLDKGLDLRTTPISEVMTKNSKTIPTGTLAVNALKIMEQHAITSLVVLDQDNVLIGVIHMHDLLKAGIV